jgi:uncharacterized protein YidB (DUF937 family)
MLERVKKGMGDNPLAVNIKDGVGELVERFRQSGQGSAAESWVVTGPNTAIDEVQLEKALGKDLIDRLMGQTRLSRETLLSRLSQILPEAVDKLTPDGQMPSSRKSQDPVYGDVTRG